MGLKARRVRERNIRLLWTNPDGAEHFRDFSVVSEAREHVPGDSADWVIFEIDHPHYAARGRVLDARETP